ncbi:MAG: phosphatidate cytidylyltransferase [Armatimonadota bacterium]
MQLLLKVLIRAVVGLALLGVLFGSAWLGGWWWLAFVSVITLIALDEYYNAIRLKHIRPDKYLGMLCSILILIAALVGEDTRMLAGPTTAAAPYGTLGQAAVADVLQITLLVLLFCVAGTLVSQFKLRATSAVVNTATTVFGVVWVGVLLSFVVRMRYLDIPALAGAEGASELAHRLGALLLVIGSVWACDSGAYLAGSLFGRTKLAPRISPGKTVEGSVAGLVVAAAVALAIGAWLGLPARHCLLLGVMMGAVGQLGDLGKSVLKRDVGIKDFGSLFGPHGGVLDRFDAILVCMPLVYWYFWFLWMDRGA